jgi:hypothetical protein
MVMMFGDVLYMGGEKQSAAAPVHVLQTPIMCCW